MKPLAWITVDKNGNPSRHAKIGTLDPAQWADPKMDSAAEDMLDPHLAPHKTIPLYAEQSTGVELLDLPHFRRTGELRFDGPEEAERLMAAQQLEAFPNLQMMMCGATSGRWTEWPAMRAELRRLMKERSVPDWALASLERLAMGCEEQATRLIEQCSHSAEFYEADAEACRMAIAALKGGAEKAPQAETQEPKIREMLYLDRPQYAGKQPAVWLDDWRRMRAHAEAQTLRASSAENLLRKATEEMQTTIAAERATTETFKLDATRWRTLRTLSHHIVLHIIQSDWSEWNMLIDGHCANERLSPPETKTFDAWMDARYPKWRTWKGNGKPAASSMMLEAWVAAGGKP